MINLNTELIKHLVNKSCKEKEDTNEYLVKRINELEKEYKKLKDENNHLNMVNHMLQEDSKVNAKTKSYAGKLDEYHLAKLEAEHQVLTLEGKVYNLEEENRALKKEVEKLKEKNELYKTSIETQKNDIEELNEELRQQRNKFKFWKKND